MDKFINSRIGLKLAFTLARITPPWCGYAIARLVARGICLSRKSQMVRAARANQYVVLGGDPGQKTLDKAAREVFDNAARSVYELYHHLGNLESAGRLFVIEPSFRSIIERPKFDGQGLVMAGLHLSGFDLAFQWLCSRWIDPLGLTIPDPQGARWLEFELRKNTLATLVPASVNGLRQAIRYLRLGGLVVTGIDRPDPLYEPRPTFFGHPASLPSHHVFLALKAKVPVVIAASQKQEDGLYHLIASPPIEIEPYPDRAFELAHNAEKVLAVAETFIQQAPSQWLISHPVWPEVLNRVKG